MPRSHYKVECECVTSTAASVKGIYVRLCSRGTDIEPQERLSSDNNRVRKSHLHLDTVTETEEIFVQGVV
jgi:hypothetical protein